MISWIAATLASGLAHKALGLMLTTLTIALFILNLRRAGERTGRAAERLETLLRIDAIQRQMLEAAARHPRSRNDLVDRLRDSGI